jgi:feruloyl esterase
VVGVSRPSSDSNINFEVWLPQAIWNGKFLSTGEGGFAGVPNYSRGNGLEGGLDALVRRGYATASTDTGHSNTDPFWAVGHPQKAIDYLYRAKHLVTIAAKGLVAAYYGQAPNRSYFSSCSNGGRQGLMEAQRYPEDYDGIVVGAPWNYQSHSTAGIVWDAQVEATTPLPAAKLPAITAAALAACDASDGLVDGVIANPQACNFNPATLLCTSVETNSCLTQSQLTSLIGHYHGPSNPRTGEQIFSGWSVGGEAGWTTNIVGTQSNFTSPGRPYFSNLVYENPSWDYLTFNFDSDMAYADAKVGSLGNSIAVDMSAARNRGVKIIQYQGWNDQMLQPGESPQYYSQVASAMGGLGATQNFYRLFMVPGMMHCSSGPGATSFGGSGQQPPPVRDAIHDIQTALENWVERGIPPDGMIATKYTDDAATTRTILLQRPLCLWPLVPRYTGGGNPSDASNFSCVGP